MFGRPTSQTQQTERLSSPPPMPKKSIGSLLTVSAYSADLSSDASLNKQRILGESLHKNSNSNFGGDGNGGGQSEPFGWDAEGGGRNEAPKGLKPRRGMARRAEMQKPPKTGEQGKQLLCLSASVTSGTSPAGSSSSACSSVEPTLASRPQNDANRSSADVPMSVSRCSSILDLFGIRRRKPSPSSNSSAEGSGRVIGTFSNMMDSLITRRTAGTSGPNRKFGMFVSRGNRRHSQQLQYLGDEPSPPYSPAVSPIFVDGYSSGEMAKMGTKPKTGQRQKLGDGRMESEPNLLKNWHKSNESVLAGEGIGTNKQRKGRPRSCFLGPPQSEWTTNERREGTESGKKAEAKESRNSSLEQELCLEMQLLRARNARLIGQLRQKSGQLSMAEARADKLGRELDQMRAQKRLDASLGANCVRMAKSVEKVISELKDQLSNSFRAQLQSLRLEAQRHQQMALNASRCDRQSLRASMAEVERLQHENCALLQKQANARPCDADGGTQLHDLLSSYDALYAFAAGIVRKLGQMRERVAEKDAELFNLELEALQSQSQALLVQTNCEWLRVKCPLLLMANASDRRLSRRPKSFHGQTLEERMTDFGNLQQRMNLPFKLIAQRIRQHRDKKGPKWAESEDVTNRFDVLMEENEQNIELEFLRLFKSARALARISGTNCELTDKSKTEGNLVPPFCVDFSFPSQIAGTLRPQQRQANQSVFPCQNQKEMCANSPLKVRRNSVQQLQQNEQKSPLHSPMAKFRRLSAIFGGWSARVEANVSPPPPFCSSGAPMAVRRVPLPNSPQLRPQRPALSRQFSIHSSDDMAFSSHLFAQFSAENATNKNCFSKSVPFYECLPPQREKIGPSSDSLRPPQMPAAPSAAPSSVLNLTTLSRLPQPNASGFPVATSSTRRPLNRTRGSESPTKDNFGGVLPKCQDKVSTQGQMDERQSAERDWSRGRIGPAESRSSSASRLPTAIGQNAKKVTENVPSAAKKAGISWLGRLRRKEGQKPNE